MSLRDLDIEIDLDVKGSELAQVNQQIDNLIARVRTIGDIDIDADLDDSEAKSEIEALQNRLNRLNDEQIEVDIETDFNYTLQELSVLSERVNALDHDDIFIDVDLQGSTTEILMLRQQLRVLEMQASHINIDVDTAGAHAQLAMLQAHINGIRGPSIDAASMNIARLATFPMSLNPVGIATGAMTILGISIAIASLLPTVVAIGNAALGVVGALGVAIGVLSGATLGLASAVGVAGIGLMGFGAIAIATITELYGEDTKLTAAQVELKKETDSVVDSWNNLKSAMQPFTFYTITAGAKAVNTILESTQPIMRNTSLAVGGLFDSLNQSLKGNDMKEFFNYAERAVGPLTMNLGKGVGSGLQGVLNIMTALEPLTSWVGQGFENMMDDFSKWTSGLKNSDDMKSFIDYTKENLPKIGGALGDMTLGVIDFVGAFSGISEGGFDWFEDKMKQFREWAGGLDENEGFQEFLSNIQEAAPIVGELITNISSSIGGLWTALSDDPENNKVLSGLNTTFERASDFINDPTIQKIMNGTFSLDFEKISEGMGEWFDQQDFDISKLLGIDSMIESIKSKFSSIKINIADWFNGTSIGELFNEGGIDLGKAITKINWKDIINPFQWPKSILSFSWDNFVRKFNWPNLKEFSWGKYIKELVWPKVGMFDWSSYISKFSWPKLDKLIWSSYISKFNWPKLPTLNWSSYISKFSWPHIPNINWSSFIPKFSWPKVSIPKINMPSFGFSSGLGRVPQDMNVIIHKDEAVIQASEAQKLRDTGILSGDGRYPKINTNTVSTTSMSTSSVAPTNLVNNSGSNTFSIPITVTVQGGTTNHETGHAVASAIENVFANFRDVFPAMREG